MAESRAEEVALHKKQSIRNITSEVFAVKRMFLLTRDGTRNNPFPNPAHPKDNFSNPGFARSQVEFTLRNPSADAARDGTEQRLVLLLAILLAGCATVSESQALGELSPYRFRGDSTLMESVGLGLDGQTTVTPASMGKLSMANARRSASLQFALLGLGARNTSSSSVLAAGIVQAPAARQGFAAQSLWRQEQQAV